MMSLQKIMNGLGHYAKKVVNTLKKPKNTILALATLATMTPLTASSQYSPKADTVYATGIFLTENIANENGVDDVILTLTPETMEMAVPDTTYTFITDGNSMAVFENPGLPVYIDSTVDINDLAKNKPQVLPTVGSELNAFFSEQERGVIELYNMSGQVVKRQEFSADHDYVALNDLSSGMYVYSIQTESGIVLGGKFVKQNVPMKGPASRPQTNDGFVEHNLKDSKLHSATYWAKWEHPDFYTDSALITLNEGANDPIFFYLESNVIPIPQYQHLSGIAKASHEEGYTPLENMTAILYNQTTNETFQTTTDSDGNFSFSQVPSGSVCFVSVGGDDSRISFNDIEYSVPSIFNMHDTIADFFSTVHDPKNPLFTIQDLKNETGNGTRSQERTYFYDNSVTPSEKLVYESWFEQLQAMSNDYTYTQVFSLDDANIQIVDGTYNTITDTETITTPIGTLHPVFFSSVSLNTGGDFGDFSHEMYQANGKAQTAGSGVLGPNPPATGPTASDLAKATLEMNYWVYAVYTNQETFVDLNLADEFLETKSPKYQQMMFKENQWQKK